MYIFLYVKKENEMYQIKFSKRADKFFSKQTEKTVSKIVEKIEALAVDPYADNNNVTKLQGREGYRLRIGNIRVIYNIYNDVLLISVVEIGFRGDIYG